MEIAETDLNMGWFKRCPASARPTSPVPPKMDTAIFSSNGHAFIVPRRVSRHTRRLCCHREESACPRPQIPIRVSYLRHWMMAFNGLKYTRLVGFCVFLVHVRTSLLGEVFNDGAASQSSKAACRDIRFRNRQKGQCAGGSEPSQAQVVSRHKRMASDSLAETANLQPGKTVSRKNGV